MQWCWRKYRHKYVLRYKNSLLRVSFEGSHISRHGSPGVEGLLFEGRNAPNSCLHFVLKRQALISWLGRFTRSLCSYTPSLFFLATLSVPSIPLCFSRLEQLWRGETLIQFHLARCWQTLPPHFFPATSLSRRFFFTATRRRTIYNLNPPTQHSGKCSLFPAARDTSQWKRKRWLPLRGH